MRPSGNEFLFPVKALVLIVLTIAIFGTAAYWTHHLFVRPQTELQREKSLPPEPPPPDPSLPEFEKCTALQKERKLLEARAAFEEFLEHNPQSGKLEDARDRLGEINTDIFFSSVQSPDKQLYVVKSGDVLNRVASRFKTTPELIMRQNNLTGTMLKIGQRLMVTPVEFSVVINKRTQKVTLYSRAKFFKQYPIRAVPSQTAPAKKTGNSPIPKLTGRIADKIAWSQDGERVVFTDKGYAGSTHWIVVSVPGYTLFSHADGSAGQSLKKPPSGLGIAPEHAEELAALLSKGNPVTIEP